MRFSTQTCIHRTENARECVSLSSEKVCSIFLFSTARNEELPRTPSNVETIENNEKDALTHDETLRANIAELKSILLYHVDHVPLLRLRALDFNILRIRQKMKI